MAAISSFFHKINALYAKLLYVVLAFVLMIVSSSLYVNNMLRDHLRRNAIDTLTQTKRNIEAEFIEPQAAMIAVSESIRGMILDGISAGKVLEAMKRVSSQIQDKQGGFAFDGLYGYFDTFKDDGTPFLNTNDWNVSEDFDPSDRIWYRTALEAGGKIAVTPFYLNLLANDYMLTYVRQIVDDEGKSLGVICMNMSLGRIKDIVADMHLTENTYGLLHDDNLDLVYYRSPEMTGKNVREITGSILVPANNMEEVSGAFEYEIKNNEGESAVAYSTKLENNWDLYIVIPKAEYYRELNRMTLILVILGSILAIILSIILIGVDKAKHKADEENRQKSLQLGLIEKMREADERTQLMLDTTPLGANYWDSNYNIIDCNEESLRLLGLETKQEYISRFNDFSPMFQPSGSLSKEAVIENIKKAFEEGYNRFEWTHQNVSGELIPCQITLVRIQNRADYAVIGYIEDLRDYKQVMQKIEQRDNLLNTVNQAALVLLATENKENMMISVMTGMELLGGSVDVDRVQIWQNEIFNDSVHFVLKYEWLSEAGKNMAPVPIGLHSPYSEKPEWERKFQRGECINCPLQELPQGDQDFLGPYDIQSIVMIPLFLQDRFWGFFSLDDCRKKRTFSEEEINILRSGGLLIANAFLRNDMTQNIRSTAIQLESALREAQDANMAKSKFLATMSHEIRTPMNVILGVTESQLLSGVHSREVNEAFEKIYNSGDLLLHIINDILDLSKIEAGKLELIPGKYEMLSLINDISNINVIEYGHKHLTFKLKVDENLPVYLYGDELRIKQILNNVLSNAFKYTNEGEVSLSFSSEKNGENKITLVINVTDTGQGMTPDQVNRLFDEYSRFNLEANRATIGTGLGMAITRNLIRLMKGQTCVDSTPGKGTSFTIHIPQDIAASGVLGRETAEKLQDFHFSHKMRERYSKIVREAMPYGKVLVVDDMKSNVDVARLLLNPYSLQIDSAESGFEAIDIIKKGNVYDIVFMDHMMPGMDGMVATKKMRELGYKHPIIALTANAVAGQMEIFLANGFDGYISKPIDIRQLNDSLNKHIRDKEYSRLGKKPAAPAVFDISEDEEIPAHPAIGIPGVNADTGIALYGGDFGTYVSVLRSFVPNALSVIEKLRSVLEESLGDYAVNVHGLKGISASIGAEKVREEAYDLEMKAKSGNLSGIMEKNDAFLEKAKGVASGVQIWLNGYDEKNQKQKLAVPDRVILASLQKSCETYDMKGIDDAMDELESAEYEKDASLVTWLREKIDLSELPSAAVRISGYLEEPT